jgi:hypothetical protein
MPGATNLTLRQAVTFSADDADFEEEIRSRAYALYKDRGREDGHAGEDWLRAEEELTHKRCAEAQLLSGCL